MEGRQGRGRPRTRARNHIEDSPTEAVDRRSEAEPAGGQGRDRDLDDRLIAAYERGRQAERRDATVGRYHRQYLDRLDGGISMIVDTPMAIELQAMMDHAEQVELHSRRWREQLTERNVKQREDQNRQIWSRGGPSTARPLPRQIATPVLQPDFVPMWCHSCNHAHSQQDCRRRNSTCFTCGNLEHWARQCPNAALGFPRDSGNRGPTGHGQGGPTFSGRSVPQHGGGRTGGRMSAHALGISEASYDAAGTLEESDGSKPSDSRDDGMTGIISILNVVDVLCDRYRVEPVHSIGNLRREM